MTERTRAILALVLVTALWGTSFPLTKSLNLQIDQQFETSGTETSLGFRAAAASGIIALRFSAASLLLLVCFPRLIRHVGRPQIAAGAAIGLVFLCGLILQVIGLATIPASRSGFLTSLVVVFVPLFATFADGRLPAPKAWAAVGLALLGAAVLTGLVGLRITGLELADEARGGWTLGDSLTVASALFFSGHVLLVDRFGKRYDSLGLTPSMFVTTAVGAWIGWLILSSWGPADWPTHSARWLAIGASPPFWIVIVALAVLPSFVAFALMNRFQPTISAVEAAILYTLEPVFASTFAMFLPAMLAAGCGIDYANETVNFPLCAGGALIVAANLLALRRG